MSIQEDVSRLLLHMAEYLEEGQDESLRGHYSFNGKELADALTMAPSRLDDVVEILESKGYVKVRRGSGTRPFGFAAVSPTSHGRAEAERIRAEEKELETTEEPRQGIQEDASRLLLHMAEYLSEGHDESTRGHYDFNGQELADALTMAPTRLNDCVEILKDRGYVETVDWLDTGPFGFGEVSATPRGRAKAERMRAEEKESETAEESRQGSGKNPLSSLNTKQQQALRWLATQQAESNPLFERDNVMRETGLSDGEFVQLLKLLEQEGHVHDMVQIDGGKYGEAFMLKDTISAAVLPKDSPNDNTWWGRYHNHVYGAFSIVSVVLAVFFFLVQSRGCGNSADRAPSRERRASASVTPEELKIISEDDTYSPISLKQFFEKFYDSSLTELQHDEFVNSLNDRRVVWEGVVKSVKPERSGELTVVIHSPDDNHEKVFLKFDNKLKEDLLGIKLGQQIRATGIVSDIIVDAPFVRHCQILKVLDP